MYYRAFNYFWKKHCHSSPKGAFRTILGGICCWPHVELWNMKHRRDGVESSLLMYHRVLTKRRVKKCNRAISEPQATRSDSLFNTAGDFNLRHQLFTSGKRCIWSVGLQWGPPWLHALPNISTILSVTESNTTTQKSVTIVRNWTK